MSATEAISLLRTLPPDELAAVGSWLNSMLATPPPHQAPPLRRPKVGEMIDEPFHVPDEAFAPLSDEELKAWGL